MMHENLGNLGSLGRVFCGGAKFLNFLNFPKKTVYSTACGIHCFFENKADAKRALLYGFSISYIATVIKTGKWSAIYLPPLLLGSISPP